jgi:HEAT repeat protein
MPATGAALRTVRRAFDRAAFQRRVQQVVEGRVEAPQLDLAAAPEDSAAIIATECHRLPVGAPALKRVIAALDRSGDLDRIVDGLASRDRELQLRSVRLTGALRHEPAVLWLEPLLASSQPRLRTAVARALGRIGGSRASRALVRGLGWRRGSTMRLVLELARAAPDLYLEAGLVDPQFQRLRPYFALAAGLRRKRTALPTLLVLLETGTRTERALSARAVGWIGAMEAGDALGYALSDPEWQVRNAAAKALGSLTGVADGELDFSMLDRNARVRKTTEATLRRRRMSAARQRVTTWR